MPGKHRKSARLQSASAPRRWVPSLAATAVAATSLTTALTTGTTVTVAAPAVELTALITPANSTAQIFASSDYYGVDWVGKYGQPQVVPFFLGPQGIVNAIDRNYQKNPTDPIAVLASGWGAGQTGTAIGIMAANHDPALKNLDIVVLDNNTNRAGGGFWTTYSLFAPLLLTSGEPTPSTTKAPILDVAYEYDINSDAPTDPLNLFADANSLVAYVYDYGGQASAPVPQYAIDEAKNPNGPHYHYILNPDGTQAQAPILLKGSTTTYVTFKTSDLPLVRPLRLIPGGDIVADAVEPTLTKLVNAGYKDNQPIPTDPTKQRPMEPGSSISNLLSASNNPSSTVQQQDVHTVVAASQRDLPKSGNLGTNPFNQFKNPTGVLTDNSFTPSTNAFDIAAADKNPTTGKKNSPDAGSANTPSLGGPKGPVRQVLGNIRSAIGNATNSLTGAGPKNSKTNTPSDSSSTSP